MGRKKRRRRHRESHLEMLQQTERDRVQESNRVAALIERDLVFERNLKEAKAAIHHVREHGLPKERAVHEGLRTYWEIETELKQVLQKALARPTADPVLVRVFLAIYAVMGVSGTLSWQWDQGWEGAIACWVFGAVALCFLVVYLSSVEREVQEHDQFVDAMRREKEREDALDRV